jgi:hypothetical protein
VEWTFARFLLALANPAIVYYNVCALVPDEPRSVESWRQYYFSNRRRYFSGVALWAFVSAIGSTVLLETPFDHPVRVVQASILGIGILGVSTSNPRTHAAIAIFMSVLIVISAVTLFGNPDEMRL